MRNTSLAGTLALLGMAACSAGPNSYAAMTTGVGFGDYQRYLQSRETGRAGSVPYSVPPEAQAAPLLPPAAMPATAPARIDAIPLRAAPAPAISAQPLAAPMITAQPLAPMPAVAAAPVPLAPPPIQTASVGTVRTVAAGAAFGTTPAFDAGPSLRSGVSDEQDFTAVSARETIESDRERLAQHRAQYQVIEVTSVPDASVSGGPNIVAYALSVSHAPGTEVYRRINPLRWARWENACLQYRNQDAAQEAFLANGGPQRDRDNLDPDGDGYACWWDPTPLRQAVATSN